LSLTKSIHVSFLILTSIPTRFYLSRLVVILQNFKELPPLSNFRFSTRLILFHLYSRTHSLLGRQRYVFPVYLPNKKRDIFSGFFTPTFLSSQSRNPISPTLQSTLRLKSGCKCMNHFL